MVDGSLVKPETTIMNPLFYDGYMRPFYRYIHTPVAVVYVGFTSEKYRNSKS